MDELAEVIYAGKASADPAPYDDPMSFYEPDPDLRVAKWLQAIWRGRGVLTAQWWRLSFVVVVDDEPIGIQDIIGASFATFGTVTTFSWVSADHRRRGIGHEMRSAALHLAFDGLAATGCDVFGCLSTDRAGVLEVVGKHGVYALCVYGRFLLDEGCDLGVVLVDWSTGTEQANGIFAIHDGTDGQEIRRRHGRRIAHIDRL